MSLADAAAQRAFLAETFPAVAQRLAQGAAEQFSLVAADGVARDIAIKGQGMYAGDAPGFTAAQLDAYKAKPLRIYMNTLDHSGLVSPVCTRLVHALRQQLVSDGLNHLPAYPVENPSFLVVFGLGLGYHLDALARHTGARWLVLVEPIAGFFEHSCAVVDWRALTKIFEERGGGIHIVTETDPGDIAVAITRIMASHGIAYADGTWVFTHHPFWAFAEARKRLHEAIEFAFVNRGFFEDELRMMSNAVANFAALDFRLLEGKPRLARPEWAAVVGAGPSLDECLETLQRVRDRIVLFSCGTSLRPLLRAGIVPDVHCELENVPEVFDVIGETSRYGDLSKVTLVASATVDPRVPAFFGKHVLYFREQVSSTQILGAAYRVLPGTAPTCVNLGLAAAAFMGFNNIALFGTDCGVRAGAQRHAEGTVYRELGVFRERDKERPHSLEVEGNFGGVVQTDWVYDACRLMLAAAIATHRFNIVNCSDGAMIPGARPCVPEAFEIAGAPVDRAAFAAAVEATMPRFAAGEMLRPINFAKLGATMERLMARIADTLFQLAGEPADFAEAYRKIATAGVDGGEGEEPLRSFVSGTLNALPRIAMFYGFRVSDPEARQRLYDCAITEIRAICDDMSEGAAELFAELEKTAAPIAA